MPDYVAQVKCFARVWPAQAVARVLAAVVVAAWAGAAHGRALVCLGKWVAMVCLAYSWLIQSPTIRMGAVSND